MSVGTSFCVSLQSKFWRKKIEQANNLTMNSFLFLPQLGQMTRDDLEKNTMVIAH